MKEEYDLSFDIVASDDLRFAERRMRFEDLETNKDIQSRACADMNVWLQRLVKSGLSPEAMELYMLDFVRRVSRVSGHWARSKGKPWNEPFNAHNGALASAELRAMSMPEVMALITEVSKEPCSEKENAV